MDNRGFEMSFAWMFALIVGAVIIFLAIYATTSLIGSSKEELDAETGKQIEIILNPVETNLESGKYLTIRFPDETRIYNDCDDRGEFGEQGISASVSTGIGKEWQKPTTKSTSRNKYVFSEEIIEGRVVHIFVKPFDFPYKVSDLIFMSTDNYCFVNAPEEIEEEISGLGNGNINVSFSVRQCPRESKKVCFSSVGCDIDVNTQAQVVTKNGQKMYYSGALIYGAIFSEPEVYECQVKRIMKRDSQLAKVYSSKASFLSGKGCGNSMESDLSAFATNVLIDKSDKLINLEDDSEQLRRKNDALICRIF